MSWTAADIDRMKELARAGETAAQVGEALGRTRCAILGKAHRIGLTFGTKGSVRNPAGPPRKKPRRKTTRAAAEPPRSQAVQPALPTPAGEHHRAPLLDLRQDQCRFPLWQPGDTVRNCCGAPCDLVDPYCEEHMRRTHTSAALARKHRAGERKPISHTSLTARWT